MLGSASVAVVMLGALFTAAPAADAATATNVTITAVGGGVTQTSTNHNATLFIGDTPGEQQTLANQGNGTHKLQFDEVNTPTSVSVFSSFGGTATATITQ